MYGATLRHVSMIVRAGSARISESRIYHAPCMNVPECHGVWVIREEATSERMNLCTV